MGFLRVWLTGYYSPDRLFEELRSRPAPHWGLFAQFLRGVLDSLVLYLPVYLMGRQPPTPSFLPFVPTEGYYLGLVWLAPVVLVAQMLVGAAVIHVLLRLLGRESDIDQIINIIGMAALIVGTVLIPWDWAMYALGVANQYVLGVTHLVIALWAIAIEAVGLNRILGVPVGLAIVLAITTIPVGLPFAVMFMRSPF
jgi:hypothetical protein